MNQQDVYVLEQKAFMKGSQRFEILQDGNLELTFKQPNIHRQFKLPLLSIAPNPERIVVRQLGNQIGCIVLGSLALGTTLMFLLNHSNTGAPWFLPLGLFGIGSLVCFRQWKVYSVDVLAFHLRQGGQIHIWFEKPDAGTFHAFCKSLTKKAEQTWNSRPAEPPSQGLSSELMALKNLKDSGVLNDAEFERAKAKLLEQTEQKRIGFI